MTSLFVKTEGALPVVVWYQSGWHHDIWITFFYSELFSKEIGISLGVWFVCDNSIVNFMNLMTVKEMNDISIVGFSFLFLWLLFKSLRIYIYMMFQKWRRQMFRVRSVQNTRSFSYSVLCQIGLPKIKMKKYPPIRESNHSLLYDEQAC